MIIKSVNNIKQQDVYPWHSMDVDEVLQKLKTDRNGLDEDEAKNRLLLFGKNILPSGEKVTVLNIIWHQLVNPLILILLFASVASISIGEFQDAFFILIVIVINTALGTYQEYRAKKNVEGLQRLMKIKAVVVRKNKYYEIDAENLVPGDLVELNSGQKVPADIRLIQSQNLEVDESFLTGESVSSIKNLSLLPEDTLITEQKNMLFAGSVIISGRGQGVVVNTGTYTQVGKIAYDVSSSKAAQSPLTIRMSKFIKQIGITILLISLLMSLYLWWQGMDLSAIFFLIVALAVSAIPEGLPVAVTAALSIAAKRMAKRNVIVRKLAAVESLGSCTVIASDKTGTLTVNEQTARWIILPDGKKFEITGEGYNGQGNVLYGSEKILLKSNVLDNPLAYINFIGVLANEAELKFEKDQWAHHGDSMDVALLALSYKLNINPDKIRNDTMVIDKIPYESEKKFAGSIIQSGNAVQILVKGAVETVLHFCDSMMKSDGNIVEIDREYILREVDELGKKGYRTLVFAFGNCSKLEKSDNYSISQFSPMCMVGMVAFIDPLRKEAKNAIQTCRKAGIKVIMITGDHPTTAKTIAKELGIIDDKQTVLTGTELQKLSSFSMSSFDKAIIDSHVFARVTPAQKLQIIDVLIKNGEFVAVTGDGVNDAPALKRANIGIAMGSGTDVTKEISEMIIVDDNFSSIVVGVEEGRYAYDNVRKVIYLLISTGAAEVLLFVLSIAFSLPLPLLPVQLLWLNLVTNGIQDVSLAFEKGEEGTMNKKPRNPNEKIFNSLMIAETLTSALVIGGIVFGLWYWLIIHIKMSEYHARDMVLLLMVFMQNFHVFNCRSETSSVFRIPLSSNWFLVVGVVIAQGVHIISMHIPFMQRLLKIEPITIREWFYILLFAIPILICMEIFKLVYRNTER